MSQQHFLTETGELINVAHIAHGHVRGSTGAGKWFVVTFAAIGANQRSTIGISVRDYAKLLRMLKLIDVTPAWLDTLLEEERMFEIAHRGKP